MNLLWSIKTHAASIEPSIFFRNRYLPRINSTSYAPLWHTSFPLWNTVVLISIFPCLEYIQIMNCKYQSLPWASDRRGYICSNKNTMLYFIYSASTFKRSALLLCDKLVLVSYLHGLLILCECIALIYIYIHIFKRGLFTYTNHTIVFIILIMFIYLYPNTSQYHNALFSFTLFSYHKYCFIVYIVLWYFPFTETWSRNFLTNELYQESDQKYKKKMYQTTQVVILHLLNDWKLFE